MVQAKDTDGAKDKLIFQKICAIIELRKENQVLKEKIETLRARVLELEAAQLKRGNL